MGFTGEQTRRDTIVGQDERKLSNVGQGDGGFEDHAWRQIRMVLPKCHDNRCCDDRFAHKNA